MSGPKCTTYRRDQALTTAMLEAAAQQAALREAARREEATRTALLQAAAERDRAVQEVKSRNTRISAFTTSCEVVRTRYGTAITTKAPATLHIGAQPTRELEAWCTRVDKRLAAAELELREQCARAIATQLFADNSASGTEHRLVDAAELFADRGSAEASAGAADRVAAGAAAREETEQVLARVLARLLPDCTEADRASTRDAAARTAGAATSGEASTWLVELRLRVQQANTRAEARRREVDEAVRLLHVLESGRGAVVEAIRDQLGEVVAGRGILDEPLRRQVVACRSAVAQQAEQRYVIATVTDALADMGYQVSEGFETLTVSAGALRLTRGEWSEHAVNLVVDQEHGELRTAVVRTAVGDDDDASRVDVEREEQWCESFRRLRDRLAQAGLDTEVQVATAPGEIPVPLVASPAAPPARTRAGHQERTR
ncbi:hypothetical protein [Streptomyces sp. NPDC088246]|uniref:hypothetical protein n=1 Tax=Streptomyces sp. NPDC088246 TaxID=3365842 RepID=UPI003804EDDB